jgi:hypothetical protein
LTTIAAIQVKKFIAVDPFLSPSWLFSALSILILVLGFCLYFLFRSNISIVQLPCALVRLNKW